MAFLSLTNISKVFGSIAAVEDFNLEVDKGEFVSFLGTVRVWENDHPAHDRRV